MLSPLLFCCGLFASFLFLSAAEQTGLIGNTQKQGSVDNANERCTSDLHASQSPSSFTSPGFPSNYPSGVDCSWVIRASPENQITLRFVSLEVEYERHCQYDYLTIYDGPNATFPQVGRYCGHITPADFTSSMPIILVEFHSNSADACAWRGFEIQFLVAGDSGCSCGGSGSSNGGIGGGGDGDTGDVAVDASGGQKEETLDVDEQVESSLSSPDYASESETDGLVDFETVPSDATITDGTDHIFTCSASGHHHIFWEKDGQRLVYNERVYLIFENNLVMGDARVQDSGRYSCVAYSEIGLKLGEVSAYLNVTSGLDVSDICGIVRAVEASEDDSQEENPRIVGGTDAKKGSSPWMARLWHLGLNKHICGGSLINNRWVVTAAHCITKFSVSARDIEVRLGDHNSLAIEPSEMKFRVSRIVLYEEFGSLGFDGDIALLELDRWVPVFTDYISPICLPSAHLSRKLLKPGKRARVVGWGQIIEGGAYAKYLQEVYVPIIPQNTCRKSTSNPVTDNMFCAGFSQATQGDSCQGDTGGPLAIKKGGKWYLLGLVSWGEGCDREGKYGFYTKVANFISWMRNITRVPM